MPKVAQVLHLKDGYSWFAVIFEWESSMDGVAMKKLMDYPEEIFHGIDRATFLPFYLTGERTMLLLGQSKSGAAIQRLTMAATFGTDISARAYHVMEAHDLMRMFNAGAAGASKDAVERQEPMNRHDAT